jgi:hypothetical protein
LASCFRGWWRVLFAVVAAAAANTAVSSISATAITVNQ